MTNILENFNENQLNLIIDSTTSHTWSEVAGDGSRHFLVVQVNATLYYFDIGSQPVSGNLKSFTTSLLIQHSSYHLQ